MVPQNLFHALLRVWTSSACFTAGHSIPAVVPQPDHFPNVQQDIYSLASSTDAVIKFLEERDPEAAKRAQKRYGCFDKCAFLDDAVTYDMDTLGKHPQ